jgi:hypothetical protein
MHLYHVKFISDGETEPQVVRYRVGSMVSAFDKCLREFSEAKLIKGWVEGSYKDGHGITVYAPRSTARIVAEPAPEEEPDTLRLSRKNFFKFEETGGRLRRRRSCNLIRRT